LGGEVYCGKIGRISWRGYSVGTDAVVGRARIGIGITVVAGTGAVGGRSAAVTCSGASVPGTGTVAGAVPARATTISAGATAVSAGTAARPSISTAITAAVSLRMERKRRHESFKIFAIGS